MCACPRTHSPPHSVACHQMRRHEWRRRPSRSYQLLRKDGRSFLPPGHWDKPDATPQNYSAAGSADGRRPSVEWTLQPPALRSRGWGCPHLLLTLRSVGAVSCPGQMGFPSCNDAPSSVVLWGDVIAIFIAHAVLKYNCGFDNVCHVLRMAPVSLVCVLLPIASWEF